MVSIVARMEHSRQRARGLPGAVLFLALGAACAPPPPPPPAPAPAPPAVAPAPPPCQRIIAIVVLKAQRELVATCARGAEVRLPVALGREPVGPKLQEGDRRTPEGLYEIVDTARPSRFHRFIPIDYPAPADADAALREGRISAAEHRRIQRAHESGRMPPGDTALGGEIGFHGEGPRWRGDSVDLDWTYGCIALSDTDIDFLAERITPGTPVWIVPDAASAPARPPPARIP
jgi:hypothetical protein